MCTRTAFQMDVMCNVSQNPAAAFRFCYGIQGLLYKHCHDVSPAQILSFLKVQINNKFKFRSARSRPLLARKYKTPAPCSATFISQFLIVSESYLLLVIYLRHEKAHCLSISHFSLLFILHCPSSFSSCPSVCPFVSDVIKPSCSPPPVPCFFQPLLKKMKIQSFCVLGKRDFTLISLFK